MRYLILLPLALIALPPHIQSLDKSLEEIIAKETEAKAAKKRRHLKSSLPSKRSPSPLTGSTSSLRSSRPILSDTLQIQDCTHLELVLGEPDRIRIKSTLEALINHETKSIHLSMYDLRDKMLVTQLIAAKERGIDIVVVIDRDNAFENNGIAQLQKAGCQIWINKNIKISGFPPKWHHKFIVFGSTKIEDVGENMPMVVLGSVNLTLSGLNVNYETMILVTSNSAAQFLTKYLNKMIESDQLEEFAGFTPSSTSSFQWQIRQ